MRYQHGQSRDTLMRCLLTDVNGARKIGGEPLPCHALVFVRNCERHMDACHPGFVPKWEQVKVDNEE